MKYDIFISYRRKGGYETAKHLYDLLSRDKYNVSFDIDTLRSGDFDVELYKRIDACKDFIVILNKGVFDRCNNAEKKQDWLRNELSYAIERNKNIIPIMLDGFVDFPIDLPEDISGITTKNGPKYDQYFFDEFYVRLKSFLKCRPKSKLKWSVLIAAVLLVIFLLVLIFNKNGVKAEESEIITNTNDYLYGVPPAPTFQEAEIDVPLPFELGYSSGCYESDELAEGYIVSYEETSKDSTYEVTVQDAKGIKQKYFFDVYDLCNASRSWLSYILVEGNKVQIKYYESGNAGYRYIMKVKNIER